MDNPFDGLIPDFSIFGAEFTEWWQKLFTGLWGLCIIVAAVFLLTSFLSLRRASTNNVPGQMDEAKGKMLWAGIALGGLIAFGVIMTAIITVLA